MPPLSPWHLSPESKSVEQPAEYLSGVPSSAAQPATTCQEQSFRRFAFYNIGWQSGDKKRVAANLAQLMSTIIQRKTVHAFGISEVFNITDDHEHQRRQEIMKLILDELNADSAAQPVWTGKVDVHYIFVWNTDALNCLEYKVISCGIQEHAWRKAQYFQFVTVLGGETLHVVHNHSPASKLRPLKMGRKKRVCSTFWNHVARKSSAARPAVLFSGDFNCTPLEWGACFKDLMKTQSARRTMQICRSGAMDGHKGDNAIAINVLATQEMSGFGVSFQSKEQAFSDDHDVVLVPLHWGNRRESKNSAAQPASSSTALPPGLEQKSIDSECATDANATSPEHGDAHHSADQDRTTPPPVSDQSHDSDFDGSECPTPQRSWPDTDEDNISVAPSLSLPSVDTPLYNALLEKLGDSDDAESMDTLADLFIFDKLKCKKPHGSAEQPAQSSNDPYSLGLRVENLLNVTLTQRSQQIARLATRNDPRVESPDTLVLSRSDMTEVMNEWRKEPQTWMDPASLTLVNAMTKQQDYHQACKRRFSTMLFQLFGNKSLVETFIRIPICSAAQPASVLSTFVKAWHDGKNSPQVETARENSQKQLKPRLSKQIHELKMKMDRGQWIADWVAADWDNWYHLSVADQHLWVEHDEGNLKRRMAELKAQQQPKFPGIAQTLMPEP